MSRPATSGVLLLVLAYVGFVSLGLPDGLLGVAWPSMRASFALPLDALGPLLVATTAGYVFASFASGWLLARLSIGALLALSCTGTALALLGFAAAPAFAWIVALGVLAGLGAGAIDAGINIYVALRHGPRTVSWLHACYGIGAALGPILLTRVLADGSPWQRGYVYVGLAQLALALAFAATASRWPRANAPAARDDAKVAASSGPGEALRRPATLAGVAAFFVYTGVEASAGAWSYSLLTEARGIPIPIAGFWVGAFWAGLTCGRIASGAIGSSIRAERVLRGSLGVALVGAALLWLSPLPLVAASGLALLGLGCGPVFPTLIASTPARVGRADAGSAVGLQLAAAGLGQSLLPWALGALAGSLGLEVVGAAFVASLLVLIGIAELAAISRIMRPT
jgi:fucose permease